MIHFFRRHTVNLLILKQTSIFYVCEYCGKSSRDTSLEINW